MRAAARRFALIFGGVTGGVAVVSLLIGLAAGSSARRALSVGFYVAGAALLAGSLIMGVRGPLRPEFRDDATGAGRWLGPRGVRRATPEERSSAHRSSLFLFGLGLLIIGLGSVLDPLRHNV